MKKSGLVTRETFRGSVIWSVNPTLGNKQKANEKQRNKRLRRENSPIAGTDWLKVFFVFLCSDPDLNNIFANLRLFCCSCAADWLDLLAWLNDPSPCLLSAYNFHITFSIQCVSYHTSWTSKMQKQLLGVGFLEVKNRAPNISSRNKHSFAMNKHVLYWKVIRKKTHRHGHNYNNYWDFYLLTAWKLLDFPHMSSHDW